MKWANVLPLLILIVLVFLFLRWVRPQLKKSRYERWEREGLLPHQTGEQDPHEHDRDRHE